MFDTQPVGRSGTMRVMSISSQDSGFTSQDTLYPRPPSSFSVNQVRMVETPETAKNLFNNIFWGCLIWFSILTQFFF